MSATTAALDAAVAGHACRTPAELREQLEHIIQVIDGTLAHDTRTHTKLHASLLASLHRRTCQPSQELARRVTLLPHTSTPPSRCVPLVAKTNCALVSEAPKRGSNVAVSQAVPSTVDPAPVLLDNTPEAHSDTSRVYGENTVTQSAARERDECVAAVVTVTGDSAVTEGTRGGQCMTARGSPTEATYVVTTPYRHAPPLVTSPTVSRTVVALTTSPLSPTHTLTATPPHRRLYDVVSSPSSSAEDTAVLPQEGDALDEVCTTSELAAAGRGERCETGRLTPQRRPAPPRPDSPFAHRWRWLATGATALHESAAAAQPPRRRAPSPRPPVTPSFSSSSCCWLRVSEDASWATSETWGSLRSNAAILAPVEVDHEAGESAIAAASRGRRRQRHAVTPRGEVRAEEALVADCSFVDGVTVVSETRSGDTADEYITTPDDMPMVTSTPRRRPGLYAPVDVAHSSPSSQASTITIPEHPRREFHTSPRHRRVRRPKTGVQHRVVQRHASDKASTHPPSADDTAVPAAQQRLRDEINQRVARATHAHALHLLCHDGLRVVVRLAALSLPAAVRLAADGTELLFYLTYTTTQDAGSTTQVTQPTASSLPAPPAPPWRSTTLRATPRKVRHLFWRSAGRAELTASPCLARSTAVSVPARSTGVAASSAAGRHIHERHHFPLHAARLCLPFVTLTRDEGPAVLGARARRRHSVTTEFGIVCGTAACRVLRSHHCLLFTHPECTRNAVATSAVATQGLYRVYCVVPHHNVLDDPSEAVLLVLDFHSRAEWVTFVIAVQGTAVARGSGGRYLSYGRTLWMLAVQRLHAARAST